MHLARTWACESAFPDCLINESLAGPIQKAAEDKVDILVARLS